MTYQSTRTALRVSVTDTGMAADAIVPAALMAPCDARNRQNADWAVIELYSLHYRPLMRLAVLLVRDFPTAEDVVQDSFLAMHGGWQRLRNADSAVAYLRHAVLNRSRSVLRHRAVVDKHRPNPPPDMPSAEYGALVRRFRQVLVHHGPVPQHRPGPVQYRVPQVGQRALRIPQPMPAIVRRYERVLNDIFRGRDVPHQQYRHAHQRSVMQRIQLADSPVRAPPRACRARRHEHGGHDGITCCRDIGRIGWARGVGAVVRHAAYF